MRCVLFFGIRGKNGIKNLLVILLFEFLYHLNYLS